MFKQISYAIFLDSNVEVEIINVKKQKNHPAMEYFHFWEIKRLPAAILVSPKQHSLVLPISIPNKPFKEAVWTAIENVVSSPKREKILQSIVKAYCVVLLIQGKNATENKRAQEEVTGAIEEISKRMNQLSETITEPPSLIVIPQELLSEERILLWSLGLDENEVSEPYVLKGEEISRRNLFNILSVIGESCQCGYDMGWILEMRIPLRWGMEVQSELVKQLGFDPENPMVKTEMSQILSIGSTLITEGEGYAQSPDVYSEGTIEFESEPSVGRISPAQFSEMDSPETIPSGIDSTIITEREDSVSSPDEYREEIIELESEPSKGEVSTALFGDTVLTETSSSGIDPTIKTSLIIVMGMVLLIITTGIFIILRNRRRIS